MRAAGRVWPLAQDLSRRPLSAPMNSSAKMPMIAQPALRLNHTSTKLTAKISHVCQLVSELMPNWIVMPHRPMKPTSRRLPRDDPVPLEPVV